MTVNAQRRPWQAGGAETKQVSGSNDNGECSQQLSLLAWSSSPGSPDVRRGGSPESVAAATMAPESRSRLRKRVLELLRQADATDSELAEQLPGKHPGSVSKRRCDLVRAGLVVDTGQRRPTPHGAMSAVWVAVDCRQVGHDAGGAA